MATGKHFTTSSIARFRVDTPASIHATLGKGGMNALLGPLLRRTVNLIILFAVVAFTVPSCRRSPSPPKTSNGWRSDQITLNGDWYPAVALRGAADSLDDYLQRADLSSVSPKPLTLYLNRTLDEDILPQHRTAYEAALDAIFARAKKISSARGLALRRGAGDGAVIEHGAHAEPKLIVRTHFYDNAVIGITITNMAREPYSRITYVKDFRGTPQLKEETPL
jgi:hypothetical protein